MQINFKGMRVRKLQKYSNLNFQTQRNSLSPPSVMGERGRDAPNWCGGCVTWPSKQLQWSFGTRVFTHKKHMFFITRLKIWIFRRGCHSKRTFLWHIPVPTTNRIPLHPGIVPTPGLTPKQILQ